MAEVLPWDHIDTLLLKKFLQRERQKAYREATLTDCRDGCHACGVCDFDQLIMREEVKHTTSATTNAEPAYQQALQAAKYASGSTPRPASEANEGADLYTVRIRYGKTGTGCFMGHLDVLKAFTHAIQKTRLPVYHSEGFHQKPRLSMGLALPLGYASDSEYLDIQLYEVVPEILSVIGERLPQGIILHESQWFAGRIPAISSIVDRLTHQIEFEDFEDFSTLAKSIKQFLAQPAIPIRRQRKQKWIEVNARPYVSGLRLMSNTLVVDTKVIDTLSIRMNEVLSVLFDCDVSHLPPHRVYRKAVCFKKSGLKISEPKLL